MFDLYKNIEMLCRKHGTTPTRICEDAGLSRSALSNLKNGRCQTLSVSNLKRIAAALDEDYDTVVHGTDTAADDLQALKDDERFLLQSYRTMTADQRQAMTVFCRGLRND